MFTYISNHVHHIPKPCGWWVIGQMGVNPDLTVISVSLGKTFLNSNKQFSSLHNRVNGPPIHNSTDDVS